MRLGIHKSFSNCLILFLIRMKCTMEVTYYCDRPKSLKQVVTAPLLNARQQVCMCQGSSEMTIINGWPVSQYVWHVKETSPLNGLEWHVTVKICSPSLVTLRSLYECKILEWDEKPQKRFLKIYEKNMQWISFCCAYMVLLATTVILLV